MKSDMRWLLFITAIIGIIGYADALKATSLKTFGRNGNKTATAATSTTTTSTTVAASNAEPTSDDDEVEKADEGESLGEDVVTKPPLTGIPQIDYVWDPNLPRELNGYNLSTYPFLNSVPAADEIDFKCDGLHDGFYASIKYSCQLYHHCIYGIRHDFLCANFTAFDQKTFICHFVSEVNCKSSAKYWFRNDALYKATTTTSTTTTTIAPPPTTTSQAPEKPYRRPDSRRPLRRRRPQHEYYYDDDDYDDEYVEERMNRRHKTNRNRNRRPEYDDYDSSSYRTSIDKMPPRANIKEEEDDYSYERPASRHRNRNRDDVDDYDRRPYERPRNRKRPIENKRHHDVEDKSIDSTDDRRPHSDARKYNYDTSTEGGKRKYNDRRTSLNDDRRHSAEDSHQPDDRRGVVHDDRRPIDDGRHSHTEKRRTQSERRPSIERRPPFEEEYEDYPKKQSQRVSDDEYDERPPKRPAHDLKPEIVPKVRSSSPVASIFNRPRAPPKINRPVPLNEKKKYEYVPQTPDKATTAITLAEDELYDDDYDYEGEKQPETKPMESKKTFPVSVSQTREHQRPAQRNEFKNEKPHSPSTDVIEEEEFDIKSKVSSIKPQRSAAPKKEPLPPQEMLTKTEYYDERPKDVVNKPNLKPQINFNKDEYIPDDNFEYTDEEADDKITISGENTHSEEPHNEYRVSQGKLPENHSKFLPETIDRVQNPLNEQEGIVKPILRTQQERQSLDISQVKTKFHRLSLPTNIRTAGETFQPKSSIEPEDRDVYRVLTKETAPTIPEPSGFKPVGFNSETELDSDIDSPKNRPYVRVMKRPFLPSRGGSIYLPRGLKAVGGGITTEYTTENVRSNSNPLNTGNIHLFDQLLPINHQSPNTQYSQYHQLQTQPQSHLQQQSPIRSAHLSPLDIRTTTQLPQIESPRSPLDEIFNNDYDVTLNDALNPTLKPLSQSQESPIGFSLNKYDRANPYARADVSHSPSQYRSTTIQKPKSQSQTQTQTETQAQTQSQYYDDEYEY